MDYTDVVTYTNNKTQYVLTNTSDLVTNYDERWNPKKRQLTVTRGSTGTTTVSFAYSGFRHLLELLAPK